MGIKERVDRLERGASSPAEIEHAYAVFRAWVRTRDHPEQATEEDRALAAQVWQEAFGILLDAAGGLEAVVRASYALTEGAAVGDQSAALH